MLDAVRVTGFVAAYLEEFYMRGRSAKDLDPAVNAMINRRTNLQMGEG